MNLLEFKERQKKMVEIEEFQKQFNKELAEWNKKPYWVQQSEEGDYLSDGSDLQGYDYEEGENDRP